MIQPLNIRPRFQYGLLLFFGGEFGQLAGPVEDDDEFGGEHVLVVILDHELGRHAPRDERHLDLKAASPLLCDERRADRYRPTATLAGANRICVSLLKNIGRGERI